MIFAIQGKGDNPFVIPNVCEESSIFFSGEILHFTSFHSE